MRWYVGAAFLGGLGAHLLWRGHWASGGFAVAVAGLVAIGEAREAWRRHRTQGPQPPVERL